MESPPHVPYQAYRSKRHSRTISSLPLVPNVSPPPLSRPASIVSNASIPIPNGPTFTRSEYYDTEKLPSEFSSVVSVVADNTQKPRPAVDVSPAKDLPSPPTTNGSTPGSSPPDVSPTSTAIASPPPTHASLHDAPPAPPPANGKSRAPDPDLSLPKDSEPSTPPAVKTRKTTTFRRIPATRSPLPSSPLRPPGTQTLLQTQAQPHSRTPSSSSSIRQFDAPRPPAVHSRVTSTTSVNSTIAEDRPFVAPSPIRPPPRTSSMLLPPQPPPQASSPASTSGHASLAPSPVTPNTSPSPSASLPTPPPTRPIAPYRPGFQPKGVYRPRTDEFFAARRTKADEGRVERTKLERRLEKLINLHFPDGEEEPKRPVEQRRSSSFFDLDFRNLASLDAGELWKGVVQSQALQGPKGDIRAAEQRITPWQDDGAVSKCPLCTASFHPLTNRKHHCRLCGKIMCSLPIKNPQRPQPCSVLFVVDAKTRRIEEVGEGVDYGVRKRRSSVDPRKGKEKEKEGDAEDEKFLKGVRICRECRPILAREQYYQEVSHAPVFTRFYEAFISLEKEIEDSLPQFQELLLTLSNDDQPTKEASAARKRLLDAFAQYDALAKRIRKIQCAKGSSQDRVQSAILTRANLFLQKNMFPLQSLPKPKKHSKSASTADPSASTAIDPDSALAHALQPLLEQEALLESFVEEAMTHRKFEDAKTLKANLKEIRGEIDKMVANAEGMGGR